MINLDQHSQDQNNVLAGDWHKKDAVMDPADHSILTVDAPKYSADDSVRTQPARPIEPVTPADAVDPAPSSSAHNPSPETPGDLLSAPNDDNDSNSSLSPIPSNDDHRGPPGDETQSDPVDDDQPNDPTDPPTQEDAPAATSRQSTPLTELSAPPSPSRVKEETPEDGGHEGMEMDERSKKEEGDDAEGKSDTAEDATVVAAESIGDLDKSRPAVDEEKEVRAKAAHTVSEPAGDSAQPSGSTAAPTAAHAKAAPAASSFQTQSNGILSDSVLPAAAEVSGSQSTGAPQKSPTSDLPADEKASTILQLNAELLKVCIECQTRQLMQSAEFTGYASRLQSNLTWLAAAADRTRHTQIPLPIMSPPTAVPWSSPQTINDFYHRLPQLFGKEIAKRQKEATQANAAGVKRGPDTADDAAGMRKRLDTGERRMSNSGSASSPPHVRSPSVMSNGTVTSASGMNMGMNMNMNMTPDAHGPPPQSMGMGMMTPQQPPQQQPAMRISPESVPSSSQPLSFQPGNATEAQIAQARERARQMQMRQNPQGMVPKEAQRMPPPSMPNGLPNTMVQSGNNPAAAAATGQGNNQQVMQAIMSTFGQPGLQNYHALQQGGSHPFVNYMCNNVPGFLQMPLQQQLQRMHIVQNNIQQARAQQAQRAAAAAAAAGMNGVNPQAAGDAASPFGRHSGSPPNVSPSHLQPQQAHHMQQISPSPQAANLPYTPSNGMGLSMQPNMQTQRAGPSMPQGIGSGAGLGGLPPGINQNNLTPQQRQLYLMQQQMHQRGNDGVINPQQAYAAAQEKMRQDQQSRMSNHQQQHSPPHNAGSPPNAGPLASHVGMGTPGMPGIARSARSPTDAAPVTPRIPQKRPGQNDPYHMALYNQAQVQQRQAGLSLRPGTAMGGMNPQQQQPGAQYVANGGTVNPGMMFAGGAGMNAQSSPQQNWQAATPQQQQLLQQQQQQQQFHSVSPAALQHHPDSGTPRPGSSASNNAVASSDGMGDSFDSLFNWNGT